MKKEDLLLFLQDIVEQDSDLNHLKLHYTEYKNNELDMLKKVIIKGLYCKLLLVSKISNNSKYIDLELNAALGVISNNTNWEKSDYYVIFMDIPKYIGILFNANEPKIPDEFLEFIID